MRAQRGQVFRAPAGTWAIRFYDARGQRRQRNGYRTRGEAGRALEEELRKVRLGPLYRPDVTLDELVAAYLEQYDAAPSTRTWLTYNVGKAQAWFGDRRLGTITVPDVARWRKSLPERQRHMAHRALRQVLAAAVRWKWIDENVATMVRNPVGPRGEIDPFESWEEVEAVADELGPYRALVIFLAGTGARPEEAFGADWRNVDLDARIFTVGPAFAKGRLKPEPKTEASRRRVPLRSRVVDALETRSRQRGILFPAPRGGRINIDNWRTREWVPALEAAGVRHRRIYDLRHTYATWSLAAGVNIFTLARRMGTSVQMIDRTYGHLAANADDYERELLDAFDSANGRSQGADDTEADDYAQREAPQ